LILYDRAHQRVGSISSVVIGEKSSNSTTASASPHWSCPTTATCGIAHRIAIHDGQIVALGSPEEVRQSRHPVIREFLKADFSKREQTSL
jgi:ABC-type transporter Mla maintaining outer membrane lipid asymmetry ATPase subunit MlaF